MSGSWNGVCISWDSLSSWSTLNLFGNAGLAKIISRKRKNYYFPFRASQSLGSCTGSVNVLLFEKLVQDLPPKCSDWKAIKSHKKPLFNLGIFSRSIEIPLLCSRVYSHLSQIFVGGVLFVFFFLQKQFSHFLTEFNIFGGAASWLPLPFAVWKPWPWSPQTWHWFFRPWQRLQLDELLIWYFCYQLCVQSPCFGFFQS